MPKMRITEMPGLRFSRTGWPDRNPMPEVQEDVFFEGVFGEAVS